MSRQALRSVEEIKAEIAGGVTASLQDFIKQAERDAARRSLQNDFRKAEIVGMHQEERRQLTEAHESAGKPKRASAPNVRRRGFPVSGIACQGAIPG